MKTKKGEPTHRNVWNSYYFISLRFEVVSYTTRDKYHISLLLPDQIIGSEKLEWLKINSDIIDFENDTINMLLYWEAW